LKFYKYYTLWSFPQFQISVIPACPESFRKDSRRAALAGMTLKNKHSNNGRPAVSAAGLFTKDLFSHLYFFFHKVLLFQHIFSLSLKNIDIQFLI